MQQANKNIQDTGHEIINEMKKNIQHPATAGVVVIVVKLGIGFKHRPWFTHWDNENVIVLGVHKCTYMYTCVCVLGESSDDLHACKKHVYILVKTISCTILTPATVSHPFKYFEFPPEQQLNYFKIYLPPKTMNFRPISYDV